MIEIEIPKDIRKYESKLIGPFTTRQAVCFVGGAVIAVPVFNICRQMGAFDLGSLLAICIFLPFILCGWVKVYGMTFEQFFQTFLYSEYLAPKKRKYQTENIWDLPENKIDIYKVAEEERQAAEEGLDKKKTKAKAKAKPKKKKKNKNIDPALKSYA